MDHNPDQAVLDDLTHLFANACYGLSNVRQKLEKELQRIYPDNANPMELSSRIEKMEDELVSFEQCYRLFAPKKMEPRSTHNEKPIKTISTGKPKEIEEECVSRKWEPGVVKKFVDICLEEVRKGNKTHKPFNEEGWKNVVTSMNKETGRNYTRIQLKNHWYEMKSEWLLVKAIMRYNPGIDWDQVKKSVAADDQWWENQIKVNKDYQRFMSIDMTLIGSEYDVLFSDIPTTGERAQASGQCEMGVERSGVSLKFHEDVAKNQNDGGAQDNHDDFNRREGGDSLQHIDATKDDQIVSPKPSTTKRKSKDNTNSKIGRKKLSADASLKEDIHSLVQIMSATSAAMSSCHSPYSGPTLKKCLGILQSLPGVVPQSNIWNYACNFLSKKEERSMFVLQPDDKARLSWLEFNYELAMKEKPNYSIP